MDKVLRPERLETDPNSVGASKEWIHWKRTFENFLSVLSDKDVNKFGVLINFISPSIFQYVEECTTYEYAIEVLQNIYVKPRNEIYARYILATRRQQSNETLDEYLQALKSLSKDCNFKSVTAVKYCEEGVRDAFITGLQSNQIRQRLLENKTLDLKTMFDQARALESAMRTSESYMAPQPSFNAAVPPTPPDPVQLDHNTLAAAQHEEQTCFFCGNTKHPRSKCPARDATCNKCQKKGHFAKACRGKSSKPKEGFSAAIWSPTLATTGTPESLKKSSATVEINAGWKVKALFDSGSSESFIHPSLVEAAAITIHPSSSTVSMATSAFSTKVTGCCIVDLADQERVYKGFHLSVLPGLCADLILGLNFQSQHESVTFNYGGPKPSLSICGLSTLNMDPPAPFANLTADCHPIITKSRRYSQEDLAFINGEVERLLKEGIIEPSQSPWRAQVVVTKDENHKKRLAIDYSQTINRFTLLDAFPLPRINDTINDIAQYRVFSTVDLKSAYHQVSLKDEDRPYTAFEARNGLFQFTRLPFGVTNGVACFQREMMKLVQEEDLKAVFPYLDNITICGKNQEDHDKNLTCFLEAAKQKNITYNDDKSIFSTRRLPILGYVIEEGTICPDPERLRPLRELPVPHDTKALNRCLGLFSYYSRWIPAYSDRIKPITSAKSFPLPQEAVKAFQGIKKIIEEAVVTAIDENTPFEVETDASDVALAATLNQKGRPVAFFSRTLQGSELKHASIEKEAQAIVEALRHWKHFLTGRHFTLTTDQKSVSYMFDQRHKGKIKNDKIMRWRIELSCYSFDIVYRPGKDNIPPDTLSRATCAAATQDSLYKLHQSLCHPGITRLWHFIRAKNLPYSLEEVRQMTNSCPVCCECKPKFHHPEETHLIKATQPFERINIDFKGPLPSTNKNRYFLNIIDEFSRFPFVFPCPDVSTTTVIKCLTTLFSLFGMPAYVHSDRGASFMSHELRAFLTEKGVAMSRTTSYNPAGNGQVEKYNGTIWKAITMSLKSNNLPIEHWQDVLPDVLHSVRSLLCTATNETPHERFLGFSRRSSAGSSVPTWLATPGPIYVKRNVRNSKTDPLVDEAELLQANPHYAHVRYPDGQLLLSLLVVKDDDLALSQYLP
ncbi:hypothetical protein QZH41_003048 [Actinostola sp. cb2023]|nr:hypothetical protein QZH41_003048 [Actinostola sp. cb2023]